ncbi:nuclear receptor-binding factor 2-like [Neocloeon triangulifer]|uniref:nuclear receptor-binding factor 2-like n=1 Tax=Neocloeon triangulifer TaxID=2078957 RepID=UPI00286F5D62|nr:nuclear receptor-binding factor 2-like [Neocloeon triangulifer]
MENSSLNEAHYQARCAETHLRAKRFNEASECHMKAANLLDSALGSTIQPKAIESIQLQKQYHLRQAELIQLRKTQYERYCKDMDLEKNRHKMVMGQLANDSNLHVAIFRTMEEADSLMTNLLRDTGAVAREEVQEQAVVPIKGSKHPKDDKVVVEELKTLTQHLHDLVKQLVTQLDARDKENECLRTQVQLLTDHLEASFASDIVTPKHLSPEGTPTASQGDAFFDTRTLPILAPLELPQFDFSVFEKAKEDGANA